MQPMVIAAVTVLPSFAILAWMDDILRAVYWDPYRHDATEIFAQKIDTYLNDISGAFLSVSGVVYGIICAHLLSMANERFGGIEESLREELGHLYQIIQMVKTIKTNSSSTLSCKVRVIRQLEIYLEHMDKHFFKPESLASVHAYDTLYSILPMIDNLTSESDTTFAANLADRIMDCCNDVGLCHSRKVTLLHSNIPMSLWALNVILSLGMFFGIGEFCRI